MPVRRARRPIARSSGAPGRDAARVGNWKYLKDDGKEYLFDLSTDPGEKADVRTRHPDTFERIKA
jgi:hypothetical protein